MSFHAVLEAAHARGLDHFDEQALKKSKKPRASTESIKVMLGYARIYEGLDRNIQLYGVI